MWTFLTAWQTLPFTVALGVMTLIALAEAIGFFFGSGISSALEGLFPDSDISVDAGADGHDTLGALLSWLRVGEVPILILLVIFLTSFGVIGLALQSITSDALGFLWPGWIAVIPAFLLSLPTVRGLGGVIGRIMPKDETSAVSRDSLVGRVATIVLGTARNGSAAQAKVRDAFQQDHYVMVEPDNDGEEFPQGKQVLLVRRAGGTFFAIGEINENLLN